MNFIDYCCFNKTQVFHFPPQDVTVAGDKTVLQVIVTYFYTLKNLKLQKCHPGSKFPGLIMFVLGIITTQKASFTTKHYKLSQFKLLIHFSSLTNLLHKQYYDNLKQQWVWKRILPRDISSNSKVYNVNCSFILVFKACTNTFYCFETAHRRRVLHAVEFASQLLVFLTLSYFLHVFSVDLMQQTLSSAVWIIHQIYTFIQNSYEFIMQRLRVALAPLFWRWQKNTALFFFFWSFTSWFWFLKYCSYGF